MYFPLKIATLSDKSIHPKAIFYFPPLSYHSFARKGNEQRIFYQYSSTSALFGYGTWPVSSTDANHQTTSVTYDSLGRMTSETLPGESSGNTTKQWTYTDWCSGTAAQSPCTEVDEIDRLNSTTTTTSHAFYDGEGRLVETRKPGPSSQDIVTYVYYDTAGRQIFKSNSYFVTAYTGAP